MAEICKDLKIKHKLTLTYHPQSNGQIERMNRTLIDMLKSYVNRRGSDWDENLELVLFSYRVSP